MRRFLLILCLLFAVSGADAISLKSDVQNKFVQSEQYQSVSEQANVYYAQNDIKQAQELFLSIPETERSAQNWLLLGNILQDQGKTSEAEFMYNKAIQIDDKFYKAYYNLGNIYFNDGKPNLAVEQFKKVIKLKPEYAYGHYNLACAYIRLGSYTKAKYELYTAIDLKNTVPEFHYNLAYVLKMQNKEKEAKRYLEYYNKLTESSY